MKQSIPSIILALALRLSIFAQEPCITGHVTGDDSGPVPSVVVTATQTGSPWKRSVLTNHDGYFALRSLPAGAYRLTAVKPGFNSAWSADLQVGKGEALSLDLRLSAGAPPQGIPLAACRAADSSMAPLDCIGFLLTINLFPLAWP